MHAIDDVLHILVDVYGAIGKRIHQEIEIVAVAKRLEPTCSLPERTTENHIRRCRDEILVQQCELRQTGVTQKPVGARQPVDGSAGALLDTVVVHDADAPYDQPQARSLLDYFPATSKLVYGKNVIRIQDRDIVASGESDCAIDRIVSPGIFLPIRLGIRDLFKQARCDVEPVIGRPVIDQYYFVGGGRLR